MSGCCKRIYEWNRSLKNQAKLYLFLFQDIEPSNVEFSEILARRATFYAAHIL